MDWAWCELTLVLPSEDTEIPVGPTVESRYLVLLNNLPIGHFDDAERSSYSRDYRSGFTIPLPDGRRSATFPARPIDAHGRSGSGAPGPGDGRSERPAPRAAEPDARRRPRPSSLPTR